MQTLEALDGMIGEIVAAAQANDITSTIAIVSDHGFIPTHTAVNLRSALTSAGLIRLNKAAENAPPIVESWDAQVWSGGAVGAVVLRDRQDASLRSRVAALLNKYASDPAHGIARVLGASDLIRSAAFPEAEFLVEFAPGFYLGSALDGPLLTPGTSKGTHGYLPERPEMHAAFFIKGSTIAKGRNLGVVDMRQIAPTLARVLGVTLPQARERPLPVGQQSGE
jgi:predicted AlkP superfamily pyrophosphatase or phosphodiesterase